MEHQLTTVPQQFSISDLQTMAQTIAKSRLFPSCQTPENALALMLLCQADGIHPAQAVRRYHVIQGTCSMRADAMQAEFQRQGGKVKWIKSDANEAKAEFSHPVNGAFVFAYTIKEAQAAGLVKPNSGWVKFPAAMLRARCISGGIRMISPGVVCGLYTEEEVSDFDQKSSKQARQQEQPPIFSGEPIEDAKIVEEKPQPQPEPAAITQPETKPADQPISSGKTAKQVADEIKQIRALAVKYGAANTVEAAKLVSEIIQRSIESSTQLNNDERTLVIDTLTSMIAAKELEATQQQPAQEAA